MRLARVAARGWDDAELTRREGAQMDLDEKRRRSTRIIVNDGDEGLLLERVRAARDRALGVGDGRPRDHSPAAVPATPVPGPPPVPGGRTGPN
jgi:hypothetical protein